MNVLSCICLTYGRVPQLQEAIESFRRQQCSWNTELVILNTLPEQKLELDPSDFPHVHIFNLEKRPPNLGAARNLAIAMANGTHIATWDDDDLYLPGYLQQFVRVFEREADLHWVWQNRQFYMEKRQLKKLTAGTFNTVAFTKSAWESLGGYGQINVGEDRDFVMRLTVKHSGTKAEIGYSETGFIYCWGNGVYHLSGMGNDGKTKANSWERSRVDVQSKLKRGVIPSGTIRLQPGWACDYSKLAQEFLIKERLFGEPINGLGVVLLGRYGDIINALPILKRLHEAGENPHLVVASEFADVLEGVSYVTPFPIKLRIDQLSEAMAIAKSRFKSVLRLQIYGKDHNQQRLTEAYNLETWREAGMELDFHNAEMPPVFDRRNSARESALIRKMFITEKPKLVTNLTGGVTSQCSRGPAILAAIKETFGKTHEVVEIGRMKLHRIYDLLAIMERARLIISVDTSTLHLAAATGTPVIALVNKNPWLGSAVRFNAVARIAYPEATSKRVIAEVANFLAPKLDERPSHTLQPFVSAIIAVYKPNVAKLNRCLKAVLPQVGEVVVCGDMDTPWPIAGILADEKVKLVRHPGTATGYGKKATFGAERSCGKLLLFLNDDVYLDGDVVATLTGEMLGDVAIVTHLLRYMDGTIQYAGKVRHGNGFVHIDLRAEKSRYSGPVEQESACGASMLVRRDVFFDVGGFDHRYLLYSEDDDLAMMVREHGWRIIFTPLASGLHEEHTSTSITPRWLGIMAESKAKFAAKWRYYFAANPNGIGKFPHKGVIQEPAHGYPNYQLNKVVHLHIPPTVTLVYIHVPGDKKHQEYANDFMESYKRFKPMHVHKSIVVCQKQQPDAFCETVFKELQSLSYYVHDDSGFDIGAYIAVSKLIETDMVVCFGGSSYFQRSGWMSRMVESWVKFGVGMYGAIATYEVAPHLSTSGFWCSPQMLSSYPIIVANKVQRYDFEHGPNALWKMVAARGYPVKLVTWCGEYNWQEWRKPANIFRRNDQSNCIACWHHCKKFAVASAVERSKLSNNSDTLNDPIYSRLRRGEPITPDIIRRSLNHFVGAHGFK